MSDNYEKLLPLQLVRQYTKTDDEYFVTDEELSLLRAAAFKEMEKYNNSLVLSGVRDVEQQVILKTTRHGYVLDQTIELDYPATSAYVTVYFDSAPNVIIKCAYRANFIYFTARTQNVSFNSCRPASPAAILYYQTGEKCPDSMDSNLALGCLRFIDTALNNRVGASNMSSLVISSGAYELWK